MPQLAQSPPEFDAKLLDAIPPLHSIAPCIFVPLPDDIFTSEPPRDRIERLKTILKSLDYQKEGVKENLLYMFEREKRRIILQAAEAERVQGPPAIKPGLAPSEVDEVIANMEAPADTAIDYNIRYMPLIDTGAPMPANASLRDRTVNDLLIVVEKGLSELQNFDRYMTGIKEHYLGCLEREMARIDEAGKRPEERSAARGIY